MSTNATLQDSSLDAEVDSEARALLETDVEELITAIRGEIASRGGKHHTRLENPGRLLLDLVIERLQEIYGC